jgi:predicted RNA-binding Zn ribbon-like protein
MDWQFDLCGDHLALDFANTLSGRETGSPIERIPGYPDLVSFARQAGVVTPGQATALLGRARREPKAAGKSHARAAALREGLYGLFAAVARQQAPTVDDLEKLDRELGRLCIGADLSLAWRDRPNTLDGFMGAIVHAAVKLLTVEAERSRVRICEAPDCVWLFYDSSRNRSRRWCDMRQCGNRMKARRHYARGKRGL